jgi:HAD superfamily hydrolase (TIGR01509 family)
MNLNLLRNIKAILFDLDGTLVDSMGIWGEIDREFMSERGLAVPENLQQQIEGLSMNETAQFFKETFHLEESEEELMQIWNQMALEHYKHAISLKPGALAFLEDLKRRGILCAIASSNSPFLVEACLKAHGIKKYMGTFVTAGEVGSGKPNPDVYLEAAKRLGVAPQDCLVFEDILPGIMAGINAGMKTCAVWDDYSSDVWEEKKELADYWILDYNELLGKTEAVL